MSDVLTSKECCKHEEQALAWETVFGQLRKGNKKFYLGDGTGEQLAVREIERLQRENTALRNLAENLRPGPISVALGGAEHEAPYRAAVLSQSFTPSNDPPTHQELFSAVNHFAREILRLTDAAPVACTAEPPNAGLLKEAADWIEQELKEIGDCDHSVGICACSSQQLLVRLRDAETKDESLPEIEQLGTVTMKCKPATKLEPLPPVETGEGQ